MQMGLQDALGNWHGEGIWACMVSSHVDNMLQAKRFILSPETGKFVPYEWRSDATGEF